MKTLQVLLVLLFLSASALAQAETLTNQNIIDMSRVGLSNEVILRKIATARTAFIVTSDALIELKKAGLSDEVINAMMERNEKALPAEPEKEKASELPLTEQSPPLKSNAKEAIAVAKTIAFSKSSVHPSRQALEKELMKRKDFQRLNLTIMRYGREADLLVDIGFVSGSWLSHRYVYRIYDRRSGAVVAAGETTSWGSLAENLARHIAKQLIQARNA